MFHKKIKCDKITFNKVKNAYKKVFRKYSSKQYFLKTLYTKAILIYKLNKKILKPTTIDISGITYIF